MVTARLQQTATALPTTSIITNPFPSSPTGMKAGSDGLSHGFTQSSVFSIRRTMDTPGGSVAGRRRRMQGVILPTRVILVIIAAALGTVTVQGDRVRDERYNRAALSRPWRHRSHMFDLRDTAIHDDEDTYRRTAELNTLLRTGISAIAARSNNSSTNQSEGSFTHFLPWSAWTPCSRSCKQRRHRCRNADCSGGDKLVEKRSCWRGGATTTRTTAARNHHCSVRRHHQHFNTQRRRDQRNRKRNRKRNQKPDDKPEAEGGGEAEVASGKDDGIDEGELQEVVYDLLYYDWTAWTACTRSCKKRRFRVCALRRFCKNTVLMEERLCHVTGSECEKRYGRGQAPEANATNNNSDKGNDWDRGGRKRKKKKKPSPNPATTPPPDIPWDKNSCGLRNPAMEATPRIVGGQESRRGAWPWQVAIMTRPHREQYCGGVLISPYHVLTAAHCVRRRNPKRRVFIRVGEFDLGKQEGTERDIRVAEDTVHAAFNLHTIDSDIAVLRLKTPVRQSLGTNYACVPEHADILPDNTLCYAVGWGKMKDTHLFGTERLREAEVPLVSASRCQEAFEYEITPNQMCAGYLTGGVDTCAGDSGGPLMCRFRSVSGGPDRWHVYGVTSFGEGCGEEGKYGIYTRVSNFSKWIEDAMRTGSSKLDATGEKRKS